MEAAQWGDHLLALEQLHYSKLALWAGASIVAGSLLLAGMYVRRAISSLLRHFALQCVGWGIANLALVFVARRGLELRDLAGAVRLDRLVWLNIGLDAGYVLVGLSLAVIGWRLGRRLGLVGAGLGVIVQGLALALLDLQLSAGIIR